MKRQFTNVKTHTHSDELDVSHKPLTVDDDTMKLENTILNTNQEYEQKR